MKIVKSFLLMLVVMASASSSFATDNFFDATYNDSGLGSMNYRVYLPDSYSPGANLPVVLYLHSAAERGDTPADIFQSYNNWVTPLVNETQHGTHQAILVMPQSGWWQTWASVNAGDNWTVGDTTNATQGPINSRLQLAVDILDQVTSTFNGDTNRLYITGPSMGGYGTWDAIARFPEKFAAAAPLSGGGNVEAAATTLADMPIWMFHGAVDPLISVNNTDLLYQAMQNAGGNPLYSRIPTFGHEGWDTFYTPDYYTTDSTSLFSGSGTGLYDWMFAQSLNEIPEPASFAFFGLGGLALIRRRAIR